MMLGQLSAFDVLVLVLVVGSISATFGWVGGAGARLLFSMRLDRCEAIVMTILNRSKGASGQAKAQEQRARATSAEKEAEELARKLAAAPRRGGLFGRGALSPADAAEEQSFQEIERAQAAARKAGS